ncbi:MAG: hypothetical protein M3380_17890 [Chloroflexota bacterium]|nr:hypothetical protein [Chloroflexota bacterium]
MMLTAHARRGSVATWLVVLLLVACGSPPQTGQQATPTGATTAGPPPAGDRGAGTPTPSAAPAGGAECTTVQQLDPASSEALVIREAVLTGIVQQHPAVAPYAPFEFDDIWSIVRAGDWVVVQASFQRALEPRAFVLRATEDGYRYTGQGWAGPADSEAMIRQHLAAEVPDAPAELWACVDLSRWVP